jgi:hypothetical protein
MTHFSRFLTPKQGRNTGLATCEIEKKIQLQPIKEKIWHTRKQASNGVPNRAKFTQILTKDLLLLDISSKCQLKATVSAATILQ